VIARDYEIVVGELPAQAARRAGLEEVTVVVCRLSDRRALECVLLEDARRPDLTPFETAVGYGQLIRTFHYSLPVLAKLVGKSEPQVVRTLLLLDSSKVARDTRDVPVAWPGAGRPSTAASGPAEPDIAPDIAPDVASSAGGAEGPEGTALSPALSKEMAALERHLSRALGLDVAVSAKGGEGSLQISYADLEQLEWLVRHLLSMEVHREPAPTCPGLAA
jgi:ParB family chromosome partitioning protein